MLLSFKRRFEPFVEDRSKRHTMRNPRKNPIRAGDRLDCYVDPRQKSMRLLGRWRCTKVETITLELDAKCSPFQPDALKITIAGVLLSNDEAEAFAWRDGFREPGRSSRQQLIDCWLGEMDRCFPWSGELNHWDPTVAIAKPAKKMKAAA